MKKYLSILFTLVLVLTLCMVMAVPVAAADLLPVNVNAEGRPPLEGTITTDGASIIFDIRAIEQAYDGDNTNPSKYNTQSNFDNEYFTISVAGKFLKYNMWGGNTTPYWGTSWGDATNPLPVGVTFSQTEDGDDFVYAVSMPYAVLGISVGETFPVQIKARDFNDNFVQSYSGYDGFNGDYSQFRGLWITDTGVFEVTLPVPPIEVPVDIKPQSCPNPLNTKSKGVTPVAILGTADFDVTDIDLSTIILAGIFPLSWNLEDVATPFELYTGKDDCDLHCNTSGPDGYLDLTLKFDTPKLLEAVRVLNAMGIIESFEISEEDIIAFENGEEELVTTDGIPLEDGMCLTVTLNGTLYNDLSIVGEDVVRILQKGNNK